MAMCALNEVKGMKLKMKPNSLKNYILYLLINKENREVDELKYAQVMKIVSPYFYPETESQRIDAIYQVDNLITYLFKCLMNTYTKRKLKPTNKNILSILTLDFVVNNAYDYVCFLQNDHENSWEVYDEKASLHV